MAKASAKTDVERLLDERRTVTTWLDRLGMAGDTTSDDVRARVRSDYEARLAAINGQLEEHTDELRRTLEDYRTRQAELTETESAADTRLSEAKLRHAVGEYDESKWNEVHSEILGELVKVREELKTVGEDLARMEEVLGSIEGGGARPARPSTPAVAVPVEDAGDEGDERPRQKSGGFDELAFLNAVGEGKARPSGAAFKRIDDAEVVTTDLSGTEPPPPETKKTLKCGECGEMNLPTEWYCESCGAELAAV